MKRIVCLCVILLCSISFAFAQGGSGRKKVRKPISKTAIAENAWKVFFPKFKQAVIGRDYDFVKQMMVKAIDCWIDEPNGEPFGDEDLRNLCLADWKKSSENNKSSADWNDLDKMVSGSVCKLYKEDGWGGWEFSRNVNSYGCNAGGVIEARFVFIKGIWYLQAFKQWEGT